MKTIPIVLLCGLLGAASGFAQAPARTNPKPVTTPKPDYPAALADTGKSGTASINVLVKADGTTAELQIKSADDPAFAEAAMAALVNWRFEPGTRDGVAADMRVAIPFKFVPPREQQLNALLKRKVFRPITEEVIATKDYGKKLKFKDEVDPVYPRTLMKSREVGKVEVAFIVGTDGKPLNPSIVGEVRKEFILPALVAVANSVYVPPVKDGKPVLVSTTRTLKIEPPIRRRGGGGGDDFGGGGGNELGGGGPDF